MARKVPSEAGKPGIPLFDYKIPQFSFLYINPYDTPDILKKMQKSALFSIPFHENFLIGLIFRSKPRCKKIVNRGGVVQVARKRAPQGTFHRNFTPPHERRGLNRANFSSSEEHFFTISRNFFRRRFFPHSDPLPRPEMTPKIVEKSLHRANKSI